MKLIPSKKLLLGVGALVATIPSAAFAHAGHDHSDASAALIHFAWLGVPVAVLGGALLYRRVRQAAKKGNK